MNGHDIVAKTFVYTTHIDLMLCSGFGFISNFFFSNHYFANECERDMKNDERNICINVSFEFTADGNRSRCM